MCLAFLIFQEACCWRGATRGGDADGGEACRGRRWGRTREQRPEMAEPRETERRPEMAESRGSWSGGRRWGSRGGVRAAAGDGGAAGETERRAQAEGRWVAEGSRIGGIFPKATGGPILHRSAFLCYRKNRCARNRSRIAPFGGLAQLFSRESAGEAETNTP